MKTYFPSWRKKQFIHKKPSRKVHRNSHFHMTMSTPILKYYHPMLSCFVFNPECLKASPYYLIPCQKVEYRGFCMPTLSHKYNVKVFCTERGFEYRSFIQLLIHRAALCGNCVLRPWMIGYYQFASILGGGGGGREQGKHPKSDRTPRDIFIVPKWIVMFTLTFVGSLSCW